MTMTFSASASATLNRPVITAWSAVSPYGIGKDEFVAGVMAGKDATSVLDAGEWAAPDDRACLVPGFDLREVLGRKGTRSMDRVTGLAVTAVRDLLRDSGDRRRGGDEQTALVLGTTTGSAQSMMDFTRASLVGERPFYVDPSLMPNAVMNCAAGQCAIWHRLKGPNTTIAGGRVAGLSALSYAAGLLRAGRAETVLCGAVEEFSDARAWLDHHRRSEDAAGALLGEGCAMFMLESASEAGHDGRALAEVLAVESRVYSGAGLRPVLDACLGGVLARAGVGADEVVSVSASGLAGRAGEEEREVLTARFGARALDRAPSLDGVGDTSGASAALQIGSVLGAAGRGEPAGGIAVISSVDDDGLVACAVIRTLAG